MHIILFDVPSVRNRFFPFSHTRPLADIRCGIMTMRERWEQLLGNSSYTLTEDYLREAFPLRENNSTDYLYVNSAVFASTELATAIAKLDFNQALTYDDGIIAFRSKDLISDYNVFSRLGASWKILPYTTPVMMLNNIWNIFSLNDKALRLDFEQITAGRESEGIPEWVTAIQSQNIFIEKGAELAPCILNASEGCIYIGRDAEVMDGAMIRGPFALGAHAVVKMGAKIYGATTIGDESKVGGEINNAVFFANSNKGHDGFIGNAIIGEWCNLGADTNCSNLKNNYDEVRIWDEHENQSVRTGLQFCGLIMGDHSKCGINTMFNTGTVVGVSCNIYGAGFPDKFIPSFSWGSKDGGMVTYKIEKAIETANRMMARRNQVLPEAMINVLHHVYSKTRKQRELLLT